MAVPVITGTLASNKTRLVLTLQVVLPPAARALQGVAAESAATLGAALTSGLLLTPLEVEVGAMVTSLSLMTNASGATGGTTWGAQLGSWAAAQGNPLVVVQPVVATVGGATAYVATPASLSAIAIALTARSSSPSPAPVIITGSAAASASMLPIIVGVAGAVLILAAVAVAVAVVSRRRRRARALARAADVRASATTNPLAVGGGRTVAKASGKAEAQSPGFVANPLRAIGLTDDPSLPPAAAAAAARAKFSPTATVGMAGALPPSGSAAVAALGAGGKLARAASLRDSTAVAAAAAAADARGPAAAAEAARWRLAASDVSSANGDGDDDDNITAAANIVNPLFVDSETHSDNGGSIAGTGNSAGAAAGAIRMAMLSRNISGFDSSAMVLAARGKSATSAVIDARGRNAFAVHGASSHASTAAAAAALSDWSQRPLPPNWIEKFDENSGSVYYTNALSDESSWERPAASETAPTAAAPDGGGVQRPLLPSWVEKIDDSSGSVYYMNTLSGESSWERPTGSEMEPTEAAPDDGGMQLLPLPPNWVEKLDDSNGAAYFSNTLTGEASWERPPASEAAATPADGGSGQWPLPPHWIEKNDDFSGAVYFTNTLTGESSWERPSAEAATSTDDGSSA